MLYLSIIVIVIAAGIIYFWTKNRKNNHQPTVSVDVPAVPTINEEELKKSQLDALAAAQQAKEQVTGMIEQINAVLQEAPTQPVVEQKTDSKPKKKRKYYPKKK